ncbi:hypothetical protein FNL37_0859 [Methylovorus glucosotrophus]|nr:hypothetical protein FNL37_0859 [Methylovorus glucosotrophus]
MNKLDYKFTPEQCDVPESRRKALIVYRTFRSQCLEYLNGDSDISISRQIHNLGWYTAVFRTINEARRIEGHDRVNSAHWDLTSAGYASLITVGIRRLVDYHSGTSSLRWLIGKLQKNSHHLTREMFVCHDGLPFDYAATERRLLDLPPDQRTKVRWGSMEGPDAYNASGFAHRSFDALSSTPDHSWRLEKVDSQILDWLLKQLSHPAITKVHDMVDKIVAHSERIPRGSKTVEIATYNDVDEALKRIVQVATFVSKFFHSGFGDVVPTPQFNVLEYLDEPWATSSSLDALQDEWDKLTTNMNSWSNEELIYSQEVVGN